MSLGLHKRIFLASLYHKKIAVAINLAMFEAVYYKNSEMVQILVPFLTSPITSEVKNGLSILQLAVWIGHTEIAKILLSTCEDKHRLAARTFIVPLERDRSLLQFNFIINTWNMSATSSFFL